MSYYDIFMSTCPICDSPKFRKDFDEVRNIDSSYPDVKFRDIIGYCTKCKYAISLVGSKRK